MTLLYQNINGTMQRSFGIGKKGFVITYGSTEPENNEGSNGDLFVIKDPTPRMYQKINGEWYEIGSTKILVVSTAQNISTTIPKTCVLCNNTAEVTYTILTSSMKSGHMITFKDAIGTSATNNIIIATEGSETIDGSSSLTISGNYSSVDLITDGINWYIV